MMKVDSLDELRSAFAEWRRRKKSRQRRAERETGHAASVTRGEGRRTAARRRTAPSVRMARGRVATFGRIRGPAP